VTQLLMITTLLIISALINIVLIGFILSCNRDKLTSLNIPKKRKLAEEWTDKDWGDLIF
jgi:magnesium-transporting ATPase (P-type)